MGNEEYVPDKEKHDEEEIFEMGHEEYSSSEDEPKFETDQEECVPAKGVSEVVTMKALFDFEAMFENEISFRQGDKLDVDKNLLDQASFWFNALHQTSGKKGYIPRSYVAKDDGPLQIHEDKDEKLLHDPSTSTGSYLIRRAKDDALFILSVKIEKETNSEPVKHYKIRYSENKGYYISARRYFDTLPDLIRHYSCVSNGLCCKLENPCLVNPPALPISWLIGPRLYEVTKESVELITKVNKDVSNPFFGEHCLGTFGNEFVGVKTLDDEKTPVKDFLTEALVLKDLRHDKLVRLIALCTQSPPFWIITDTLTKGDLLTYLRQDMGTGLNFDSLLYFASQIADAMDYLSEKKIVHRNLRACNVLVGVDNKIKVSGFELAKILDDDDTYASSSVTESLIPLKWTAPEAVFQKKYSVKADAWSYGVVLYEIITFGMAPYQGMADSDVVHRVIKGYRMPIPRKCPIMYPDHYCEVMLKCWDAISERRPSFAFLKDFFEHYNVYTEEMEFKFDYYRCSNTLNS
ncbi:tyrosine-protein kinase SRK2-like isoform X2 [Mercenaria mercenaria]|uniref:tyrosine-protein kinase SRK2-like isoform X2 n=1 Tax=Mercenaria mercenaria TaxID=6596 RepID=UPI00234E8DC2|nr:tyrosine-protein kinase SRK2-like isoform X2 [Mercenaria mercenaria]